MQKTNPKNNFLIQPPAETSRIQQQQRIPHRRGETQRTPHDRPIIQSPGVMADETRADGLDTDGQYSIRRGSQTV